MDGSVYNPEGLVYSYRKLAHGKARADAIHYAAEQADLNNDIPYMVFFREEFCLESIWYADEINIYTVFPELLSLTDKYPDIERTPFQYNSITEEVLYIYGAVAVDSGNFYQIPLKDCINFLNGFKERWTAAGHSACQPYYYMFLFYIDAGDGINAAKCFKAYKSCPVGDRECKGCSANAEIEYYLQSGEKEKADSLALKIENGILRCKDSFNSSFSMLRMKRIYLKYYICHGDYENAAKCAYILEHNNSQEKDFHPWAFIMCAYVYSKPGRAMCIYKKHWQEWEEERNPIEKFFAYKCAACFFKGLGKLKGTDTVKICFSGSFPLYNKDNVYKVSGITEYYYKGAEEIAAKFDKRNGTHKFIKELEMTFANVL